MLLCKTSQHAVSNNYSSHSREEPVALGVDVCGQQHGVFMHFTRQWPCPRSFALVLLGKLSDTSRLKAFLQ